MTEGAQMDVDQATREPTPAGAAVSPRQQAMLLFTEAINSASYGKSDVKSLYITAVPSLISMVKQLYSQASAIYPAHPDLLAGTFLCLLRKLDVCARSDLNATPTFLNVRAGQQEPPLVFNYDFHGKIIGWSQDDVGPTESEASMFAGAFAQEAALLLPLGTGVAISRHYAVRQDSKGTYWLQNSSGPVKIVPLPKPLADLLYVSLACFLKATADSKPTFTSGKTLVTGLLSLFPDLVVSYNKDLLTQVDIEETADIVACILPGIELEDAPEPTKGSLIKLRNVCENFGCSLMSMETLADHVHGIIQVDRLIVLIISLTISMPLSVIGDHAMTSATADPIKIMSLDEVPPTHWVLQASQKPAHGSLSTLLKTSDLKVYCCSSPPVVAGSIKRKKQSSKKKSESGPSRTKPVPHDALQAKFFQSLRNGVTELKTTFTTEEKSQTETPKPVIRPYNMFE